MTGLDKILKQIQDEGQRSAQAILADAKAEAEKIAADARAEAEKQCRTIEAHSAQELARQEQAAQSAAELAKRRAVLTAKQELIASVLTEAGSSVQTMSASEYFELILKMVTKYSLPQAGELLMSAADLSRLPTGFAAAAAAAAKGPLTLSAETRALDGGFVLLYGGVEENCSIEALLYAAREQLQDKVQELLFA